MFLAFYAVTIQVAYITNTPKETSLMLLLQHAPFSLRLLDKMIKLLPLAVSHTLRGGIN